MVTPIDWTGAITLKEYVFQLFHDGKTNTKEFKALVRFFGRAKLIEFWYEWQTKRQVSARNPLDRNLSPF